MDRFEEIKRVFQKERDIASMVDPGSALRAMDWLIAEVERLRKIEDALLDDAPTGIESAQDYVDYLMNVCRANPRPEDAS